jgi:hypothetical protein
MENVTPKKQGTTTSSKGTPGTLTKIPRKLTRYEISDDEGEIGTTEKTLKRVLEKYQETFWTLDDAVKILNQISNLKGFLRAWNKAVMSVSKIHSDLEFVLKKDE